MNKFKYITQVILCFTLVSCVSVKTIQKNYRSVNVKDGVTELEAEYIAQNHLNSSRFKNDYAVSFPRVDNFKSISYKHQLPLDHMKDAWIVVFVEKLKGYKDFSEILFFIDKTNGKILSVHECSLKYFTGQKNCTEIATFQK